MQLDSTSILVLIIAGIVGIVILFFVLKPYVIRHDTTILFTGGLGSGKTLESVKQAIVLIRKQRFLKWKCYNKLKVPLWNFFIGIGNNIRKSKNKKRDEDNQIPMKDYLIKRKKPMLYSNVPIHYKSHIMSGKREWSKTMSVEHILLLEPMEEYSVVLIDELPQLINQFNWSEKLVQENVNEFITFFRHYIGGYLICNCQSTSDAVVQIRRKLNQAVWCFDFKRHLFGLFYTVKMCDIMLSDDVSTMATTQIEENTKRHFGLFPPKRTYDSRCYSIRYNNVLFSYNKARWEHLKTTNVLRVKEYKSPLDDKTTMLEKQEMANKAKALRSK